MEAINEVQEKVTTLRCSSSTDAKKLAGSIYSTYQSNPDNDIIIRVIGAGALNQAIKGAIISNKFFAKKGILIGVQPFFQDASLDTTAIGLKIFFLSI